MSSDNKWKAADMPNLSGKVVVVTGANSGTGFETARALARKEAQVILACRNLDKGRKALITIKGESSRARLDLMQLDLADLGSIRQFAATFGQKHNLLHILINNAGVMALPYRTTADGFEMQFGVNHLGHFALTGLLLDSIIQAKNGRVVTVSSLYHRSGVINFDDLHGQQNYKKWDAYAQSKLANLLFAYELQRRLEASQAGVISVAAHPGYSATNLQFAGPELAGSTVQKLVMSLANKLFAQSAAMGALPILYAAAAPQVQGGDYIGPGGFQEVRGHPKKVESNEASRDPDLAARLWAVSEELTGIRYDLTSPA